MASQLSTKFRHQVTWNGYPLDLVKSGLQKYIRRGDAEKALYCAGEIDLFKTAGKEGEGVRTNFFNRFLVMYMEDVENLSILDKVNTLTNQLYQERKKPTEERSTEDEERWVAELVILLCHSTKARICSHIRAVFSPKYHTPALMAAYPSLQPLWDEINKNEKVRQANQRGALADHMDRFHHYLQKKHILAVYYAFQIALSPETLDKRILGSSKPVWFVFNLLNQLSPITTIMMEWYKLHVGGMKEDFMCWLIPLLSYLGALPKGQPPVVDLSAYPLHWDRNRSGEVVVMNDFVVDRHTKMGRSKTLTEFALVGAHVENEALYVNPLWKAFYNDGKRWEEGQPIQGEDGDNQEQEQKEQQEQDEDQKELPPNDSDEERKNPPKESDAYDFIVRTQITTSNAKMDVYIATDPISNALVIVKGPYKSRKEIDILKGVTEWKRAHRLPFIPFRIRSLLPDRWPEGVPLGARNRISRSEPAYFLVFDSVIRREEIEIKTHSSKVWPLTEVVDWDKLPLHFDYKARPLTDQEWKDYVHALLFRYLLGISDLADRNFLMREGRVISIDEDVEGHVVDLYTELRKNKAAAVYGWLRGHYRTLDVATWSVKDESDEQQRHRLSRIQDMNECLRLFDPQHVSITVEEAPVQPPKKIARPQLKLQGPAPSAALPSPSPSPSPSPPPLVRKDDDVKEARDTKSTVQSATAASRYPAMNENFVFIDNVYRSRHTLLDILRDRGYNVEKYEKFSPAEATAAASSFTSLSFHVTKNDDETKQCHIRYENISQQKLKGSYFKDMISDEDCENVEVVMMMSGHVTDTHHSIALKEYMSLKDESNDKGVRERRKLRVSFFSIEMLVINPLRHVLVPKHEIVPEEEHKALMDRLYITSKSKFPEIKFHADTIARCIGAVPGDIIRITRPSASSGEAIIYRVCAP